MPGYHIGDLYTGKLIRLGAVKAEEKDVLSRWSHDAEYMRMMNFNVAYPQPPSFYEEQMKEDRSSNSFYFGIRTLADDKLIGNTGLWCDFPHGDAWFWIGIGDANSRGKGYGYDATELMLGYAFRELNLYRVTLGVFGYNERARRTYEKAGFVHEGTQREVLYREGKRWDLHDMGILRSEWEARREQEPERMLSL